jgi:hypothetical protein
MKIKFNEVTWYSKLAAVILFIVVVPVLTFYIGMKYQEVVSIENGQTVRVIADNFPNKQGAGVTFTDPRNGTYIFDDELITFKNGTSVQKAGLDVSAVINASIFNAPVTGDIDGDGDIDAIFFVYSSSGGTGTFFYVVAAENVGGGKYVGTKAIFLGDRIAPQNINIIRGVAQVNYAVRKDDEPMVADPSVGVTKYVVIKGGELVENIRP